jgi:eukaryotic-like serine/threonine-protein kinase
MQSTKPSARQIFTGASGHSDPPSREAFLDQACGFNLELLREVEPLLGPQLDRDTSPLDAVEVTLGSAITAASIVALDDHGEPPRQIGAYKLLEKIGEGGFGVVYMAEQTAPVRRRVALKVIKPGMDSRQVIARFEAERQTLAMMDHPNIARIFDGGTSADRLPYFAMELVRGTTLTKYCDEARLTTHERLSLFIDLCEAVQHAHQKGIIHRDLKPSNVMVTLHDDRGVIKVIDFGVAKALSQPLTDRTLFTGYQQLLGTPQYMSPEQAQMNEVDIDTRSDVYALGVILYELLTGTTPFAKESLAKVGPDELCRIIREQEPPRPSARVTTLDAKARFTIADRRRIDQRNVAEHLRGELDWIVMKALEKDRNRRYESASALGDDVRRYIQGESVLACPPKRMVRLAKTLKRHRTVFASVTLACAMLAVGMVGTAWQAYQATQARILAELSLEKEQAARQEADQQRRLADQNLAIACETVDRVVMRFADPNLLMLPGMENVREELLHDALGFYRGLLELQAEDPQLRYDAARAWERVGQINEVFKSTQGKLRGLERGHQDHREVAR